MKVAQMADDSEHQPKPSLNTIINDMDIPITARQVSKRQPKVVVMPRYQSISDGQWYNPPEMRRNVVDDFTDKIVVQGQHKFGEAKGQQPTLEDMQQATANSKLDAVMQPIVEQRTVETWIHEHRLKLNPHMKLLRRPIDMTIIPAPKVKNDADYRANKPKVPPRRKP